MTNKEFSYIAAEDVETALAVDNQEAFNRSQARLEAGQVALRAFWASGHAFGEAGNTADVTGIRDALEPRGLTELDGEVDAIVMTREVAGDAGDELRIVARGVAVYGFAPEAPATEPDTAGLPAEAADGGVVDYDPAVMFGDDVYTQRIQ